MLSEELNCRVTLYAKQETVNELDELTYDYAPVKSLWAGILPTSGREKSLPGGAEYAEITHKVTVRPAAVPQLALDLYFLFRGQKYEVRYFMPNYKQRDRMEIYCRLVVE